MQCALPVNDGAHLDTLRSMQTFVRVAELGSFAAAARSLEMSPAMVTKHVTYLEERVGARLLHRTTRHVRPSDAGQLYLERCQSILAEIDEAESLAGAESTRLGGTLRVTAPVEFGNLHLAPLAGAFMQRHAGIDLVLDLSNRTVDLVQEGYDIAVRIADSLDTGLIGRRLATSRFHVVASPTYVEAHGSPSAPAELAAHACLAFAVPSVRDQWHFAGQGGETRVKIRPRLASTSSEALRLAAVAGVGIACLPTFVCGSDLRSGALVSLFPELDCGSLGVHALFAHRRFLPARVRAFLDFLREALGTDARSDPWGSA